MEPIQPVVAYAEGEIFRPHWGYAVAGVFACILVGGMLAVVVAGQFYFRRRPEDTVLSFVVASSMLLVFFSALVEKVVSTMRGYVRTTNEGIEFRRSSKIRAAQWGEIRGVEYFRLGKRLYSITFTTATKFKLDVSDFPKSSRERIEAIVGGRVGVEFQREREIGRGVTARPGGE